MIASTWRSTHAGIQGPAAALSHLALVALLMSACLPSTTAWALNESPIENSLLATRFANFKAISCGVFLQVSSKESALFCDAAGLRCDNSDVKSFSYILIYNVEAPSRATATKAVNDDAQFDFFPGEENLAVDGTMSKNDLHDPIPGVMATMMGTAALLLCEIPALPDDGNCKESLTTLDALVVSRVTEVAAMTRAHSGFVCTTSSTDQEELVCIPRVYWH